MKKATINVEVNADKLREVLDEYVEKMCEVLKEHDEGKLIEVECGNITITEENPPSIARNGLGVAKISGGERGLVQTRGSTGFWTESGLRDLSTALTEYLDRHDMRENGGEVCEFPICFHENKLVHAVVGGVGGVFFRGAFGDNALVDIGRVDDALRSIRQAIIKHKEGK